MKNAPNPIEELVLPSVFALFVLTLLWRRWPAGWSPRLWGRHAGWIFVTLRVALPVTVYLVLGVDVEEWGSDCEFWMVGTGQQLAGGVPGRDFMNPYGPLLPYAQTAGRLLLPGQHWVGVLLPFVLGDALALWCAARLAGEHAGARAAAWVGSWLLLTPLTWHLLALRGQDEALVVGALLAGIWLLGRGRHAWAGVVLALGFASTKPTFAIHAGAILLTVEAAGGRALRAWGAFFGTTVAVYALYAATGADLFVPGDLQDVLNNYGIGLSLPDLARRYALPLPVEVAAMGYVVVVSLTALLVARRARGRPPAERAILVSVAVQAVTMIAAPMCVAPYVTQTVAFALLLLVIVDEASRLRTLAAALLALLGLAVPILWVYPATVMEPLVAISLLTHAVLLVLVWRRANAGA